MEFFAPKQRKELVNVKESCADWAYALLKRVFGENVLDRF